MTLDSDLRESADALPTEPLDAAAAESWQKRMARLKDVPLRITVVVGRTRMPIGAVLDLHVGQVIELDRAVGSAVDIVANDDVVIARGEVVEVEDDYGVRVTEIVKGALEP